jgi:hypothetical protein
MKNIYATLLLCVIVTLAGCDLFDAEPENEASSNFELYTNPTDGTLFSVKLEDGTQITYFGEKDEDGLPTSIQSVNFIYTDETDPYTVILDEDKNPAKILATNGTVYNIEWIEGSKIRIKAITDDAKAQVSLPVDLDTLGLKYASLPSSKNIRSNLPSLLNVEPINSSTKSVTGTDATMTINVTSCGFPVKDAVVRINTSPELGAKNMVANNAGNGNYTANIPHDPDRLADVDKECDELVKRINEVCSTIGNTSMAEVQANPGKVGILCGAIDLYMLFDNSISAEDRKKISSVCPKVIALAAGLCEVVNLQKDLLNSCKLGKTIGTIPMSTEYKFSLAITAPGLGTVYSDQTVFDPEIADTWDMEIGGNMYIDNLHTEPGDPAPKQGYVAYASLICIPEGGINFTISVSGSDGYSNSYTEFVTENSTISLSVPGGAESVVDVISVQADNYTASMSVVF